MYRLILILLLTMTGCQNTSEDAHEIRINTPEGTESTAVTSEQQIAIVTGHELLRLQALGNDGPTFVQHYLPNANELTLEDYDRAFELWQNDKQSDYSDAQVVEIIGGHLGNKCVRDLAMEWSVVTDEYGTDYAVRSNQVQVTTYPFSAVLKRIEDGNSGFIHGIYHTVRHTIESSKAKTRE
jgi:hypothetical protein